MANYIKGYFHFNKTRRLELYDMEVTSGYPIEFYDGYEWTPSRIEHNGEYYIYDIPNIDPTKVEVRIKCSY